MIEGCVTMTCGEPTPPQLLAWQRLWTLLLGCGTHTSDAMADQPDTGPEHAHADAEATASALKAERDGKRSSERNS
jgi:hypothetical protein